MGIGTVNAALLQCPFGAAPSPLMVIPRACVFAGGQPAGTIMDNKPLVNILPFGMCSNPANPAVAAATAAAIGVLTPMPCIPVTTAPWAPGNPTLLLGGEPALTNSSKLACAYGGIISIQMPGQFTTMY